MPRFTLKQWFVAITLIAAGVGSFGGTFRSIHSPGGLCYLGMFAGALIGCGAGILANRRLVIAAIVGAMLGPLAVVTVLFMLIGFRP